MSPTPLDVQNSNDSNSAASANSPASSPQTRNDDSNPQQGTGTPRTPMKSGTQADAEKKAHPEQQSMIAPPDHTATTPLGSEVSRRTLAVPPFKKDARKLFVGGLPPDVTDAEFRAFFEQFGEVVDSVVMFDFDTHRSRGFGFVTFIDPEVAQRMLTLGRDPDQLNTNDPTTGRVQMREKLIEIKTAEPKESRGSGRYNQRRNQMITSSLKPNGRQARFDPQMMYNSEAAAPAYPVMPPYYCTPGMAHGYMVPTYFHPPPVAPVQFGHPAYTNMTDMTTYPPMDPSYACPVPMGMVAPVPFIPPTQPHNPVATSVMQPMAPGIPLKCDGEEPITSAPSDPE